MSIKIDENNTLENTEILMEKDGNFKSLDEIRHLLPEGDELFHLAVYKSINEGLLTDGEINMIDTSIYRLQQSLKNKLKKTNEFYDKIAEENLLKN